MFALTGSRNSSVATAISGADEFAAKLSNLDRTFAISDHTC